MERKQKEGEGNRMDRVHCKMVYPKGIWGPKEEAALGAGWGLLEVRMLNGSSA